MHASTGVLTGALAAAFGAAAFASSNTPVFKADVELVNVAVTITDPQRHFVTGLGEKDFEIFEDGAPQDLTLFTHQRLPVSLAILLDTSQSMMVKLTQAQTAATRFVRTLTPADEAQIVAFNDKARIVQDFTSDQAALQGAIQGTRASGATALYNALYVALKDLQPRRRTDQLRRMAVVVLSDGEDTASLINDDQVLSLARTSGIAVYGISLTSPIPAPMALGKDVSLPRYFFTALSRDTGGQAHFLQGISQLPGVYDELAEELRSQYNLGYVSNNGRRDGRWRNIQVRLHSRPQLQVRHKTGYYAPRR
jgi:Ca-activated chloride channel homolog